MFTTDGPLAVEFEVPNFRKVKGNWRFELSQEITVWTGIREFAEIENAKGTTIAAHPGSAEVLMIAPGFRWDLASGAIDTVDMIVPSLIHDALCQMTDQNLISWRHRETADELFLYLMENHGTPWFRRYYCYTAVRLYSKYRGLVRWMSKTKR